MPDWSRTRRRLRRRLRRLRSRFPAFVPVSIALGVLVLLGVIFAFGVNSARDDLRNATGQAEDLQRAVVAGDKPRAATALSALQESAGGAHDSTDGPLWALASRLPILGDDVNALRVVSSALDEVASKALPPVVALSTELDLNNFAPKDGKIDLSRLATLNEPIATSNSSFAAQRARLDELDLDGLMGSVRPSVETFVNRIDAAATATSITDNVLELVPAMMGKDRTYLLVFQNNAELRATGGLPGSYLVMKVDNGKIKRGDQGPGGGIPQFSKNVIKTTDEELDLFTRGLPRLFVNSNLTPEFPRTAQFMKAMAEKSGLDDIDGVISLDPVTMGYILEGTGPVKLDDGTKLTSKNAAAELINNAYFRYPVNADADAFFEDAAARIFDVVTDGKGDSRAVIRNIVRAAKERRVFVWSANKSEQAKLASTDLSGSITPDAPDRPTLGVFLNDTTGTKLDYYVDHRTRVQSVTCRDDGSQLINTDITLASNVPGNAGTFPISFGVRNGVLRMNAHVYLPTGAKLVSSHINATSLPLSTRPHRGHDVLTVPVVLRPGQKTSIEVIFDTSAGQDQTLDVATTPSALPLRNVTVAPSACK